MPAALGVLGRLETARNRLAEAGRSPARGRWFWAIAALVTGIAAVLRLVRLGSPTDLVFDETYYAKDAWSLLTLGYEGVWADDATTNPAFVAGDTSDLDSIGDFVVHPPLGKWLIALGMTVTGPGDPAGWRLAVALCGVLLVPGTMLIARRLTGSLGVAAVAGLLLAIDGLGIAMSRVALLDGPLALAVAVGVLCWLVDHDRHRRWVLRQRSRHRLVGAVRTADRPHLVHWRRPWLLLAGIALGAATAIKWSGLWYLAAFGLATVVAAHVLRRRAGLPRPGVAAWLAQAPVSFLVLVPIAAITHLASWLGWFVSSDGWGRQAVEASGGWFEAATASLQSWWQYQAAVLGFHSSLSTDHPYASPAWEWPLLLRPTLMWFERNEAAGIDTIITPLPNPLLWWLAWAALAWLGWRAVRRRTIPGTGVLLLAIAAGWLLWLVMPERTMYQFYTVVLLPYLVVALALLLREIAGRDRSHAARRLSGIGTVAAVLAVIMLLSAWWYPMWTGLPVPTWFYGTHRWLPGW